MRISDWSSDVCSSDLDRLGQRGTDTEAVQRDEQHHRRDQRIAGERLDAVVVDHQIADRQHGDPLRDEPDRPGQPAVEHVPHTSTGSSIKGAEPGGRVLEDLWPGQHGLAVDTPHPGDPVLDRTSAVYGKSLSVRYDFGCSTTIP